MISVIVPVYNNYKTLSACLSSVYAQTHEDIEVVVVDDGSAYPERIKAIVSSYPVDCFIRQENKGAPHARNRGFSASHGEYVIFLDADIVLFPETLSAMRHALDGGDASFCYGAYKRGWKTMRFVPFDPALLREFNYIHTTSLLKRSWFFGFDERLKRFQDWDLWLTVVERGGKGEGIDRILFEIVETRGTMSSWLPGFVYRIPWPVFGYMPAAVRNYYRAREVIRKKHGFS